VRWPFGKKKSAGPPAIPKDIPRDDDRRGPVLPPPRTAHAPGVEIFRFDAIPSPYGLRRGEGNGGFFLEGEEGKGKRPASALLLLGGCGGSPEAQGDVLLWTARAAAAPEPQHNLARSLRLSFSLEEISRTSPRPDHHIRRDGVAGAAFPGITGLRVLSRLPEHGLAVLRLGPPPGARWVFRGVRAFAVFSGRLAAFDGDEVKAVRAGSLARVADPSATLYLEAGNDAALGVALAADDFVAALG
jgi:hypothetical protein